MKRKPLIFSSQEDHWSAIPSQNREKIKGTVETFNQETVEFIFSPMKKRQLKKVGSLPNWRLLPLHCR